jgi:hypothetical protein
MTNGFLRVMVFGIALLLTGVQGGGFPAVGGGYAATGRVDVRLVPRHTYVAPAGLCTVQVFVTAPADSLACMETFVQYDHELLTLVSLDEGSLFTGAPYPTFLDTSVVSPDTISAVDCLLGYRSYFLPPGDLIQFVFRAEAPGRAGVRIASMRVWDINREERFPAVDPCAWITIGNPATGSTTPPAAGSLRCYPNPFNPATTIELSLEADEAGAVDVSVYSPSGRRVKTLFAGDCSGGGCRVVWRGVDDSGARVASGVYFVVARTPVRIFTNKLVLIE